MKKLILFLMLILTLSVFGCQKQKEKIKIQDLKADIQVYQLLPNNLLENSNRKLTTSSVTHELYQSVLYEKLIQVYQYIDELFIAFNEVLDRGIDNHEIYSGEVYTYNQYTYIATINKAITQLSLEDTSNDRIIHLNVKYLTNGQQEISGDHFVNYDLFTFHYLNQKQLTINFYEGNVNKKSYATINKEDSQVKTHVVYNEGVSSFELYSIATEEATAILFLSNKKENRYLNQTFEVIDKEGDVLYHAFSIDEGVYQASGWLLNALNTQDIEKTSTNKFLVNKKEFSNIPNQPNIYEVSLNENWVTYLLGHLEYNQHLVPIIQPRAPFETIYFNLVSNLASETISYYDEINP